MMNHQYIQKKFMELVTLNLVIKKIEVIINTEEYNDNTVATKIKRWALLFWKKAERNVLVQKLSQQKIEFPAYTHGN